MCRSLVALVFLALAANAPAARAAEPGTLDELMTASRFDIEIHGTELKGAGAEWLIGEATQARFFMLGEQHATREIPRFAAALFAALAKNGYGTVAVEVGPHSTRLMESMLRSRGGKTYENYARDARNLLPFPFYTWQDEYEFVRSVVKLTPDSTRALVGLDQEFIGAGSLLLRELANLADNKQQDAALATARAVVAKDAMALGLGDDAPWRTLASAFASNTEGRRITEAILVSRRIYAPFTNRGGNVLLANQEREDYMKTLLTSAIAVDDRSRAAPPKWFLKFGANHLVYGHSPTHVLSLGNFVRELALSRNGGRSFNLHVDCKGGDTLEPQSGRHEPCISYFVEPDSVFDKYLAANKPTLVDLRPLRAKRELWEEVFDEGEQRLIDAYDAYLSLPNVTPAVPMRAAKAK
jgi:hypothetical protein